MPTGLLVFYAMGGAVTAFFVLRNNVFSRGYLVKAGAIGLWPLYWSFYLMGLFTGRSRPPVGRPPQQGGKPSS